MFILAGISQSKKDNFSKPELKNRFGKACML